MSDDMWSRPRFGSHSWASSYCGKSFLDPHWTQAQRYNQDKFPGLLHKVWVASGVALAGCESEKTGQEFRLDVLWRILICAFIVCEASDRCDISRRQTLASSYQLKGCLRALKMPTMARLLYLWWINFMLCLKMSSLLPAQDFQVRLVSVSCQWLCANLTWIVCVGELMCLVCPSSLSWLSLGFRAMTLVTLPWTWTMGLGSTWLWLTSLKLCESSLKPDSTMIWILIQVWWLHGTLLFLWGLNPDQSFSGACITKASLEFRFMYYICLACRAATRILIQVNPFLKQLSYAWIWM